MKIFQTIQAILVVLAEVYNCYKASALTGWNALILELNLDLP